MNEIAYDWQAIRGLSFLGRSSIPIVALKQDSRQLDRAAAHEAGASLTALLRHTRDIRVTQCIGTVLEYSDSCNGHSGSNRMLTNSHDERAQCSSKADT
jgi:hypothetical protein